MIGSLCSAWLLVRACDITGARIPAAKLETIACIVGPSVVVLVPDGCHTYCVLAGWPVTLHWLPTLPARSSTPSSNPPPPLHLPPACSDRQQACAYTIYIPCASACMYCACDLTL